VTRLAKFYHELHPLDLGRYFFQDKEAMNPGRGFFATVRMYGLLLGIFNPVEKIFFSKWESSPKYW